MSDLNASIDAVLNRSVSVEAGGQTFELRQPTVEQHLEMRRLQVSIRKDETKKDYIHFLDSVLMVRACLGDVDIDKLSLMLLSLGDDASALYAAAGKLYSVSYAMQQDDVEAKARELKLDKLNETIQGELNIPFLFRGSLV